MPSKPLPDFPGDTEAVTQCCPSSCDRCGTPFDADAHLQPDGSWECYVCHLEGQNAELAEENKRLLALCSRGEIERLRTAVRRHRELHDAVLRLVKPWFVVSAVLADHAVEDATKGKEAEDEA